MNEWDVQVGNLEKEAFGGEKEEEGVTEKGTGIVCIKYIRV